MKSLESSHEHIEDTEHPPLDGGAPQLLPRRIATGTVPAATNTNAVPASSRFGSAVNSGIRALQYKGGNDLDGDRARQLAASGFAGGGGAMPHADAIQRSFGKHDIGGVSAHVGGAASQAADALGATGYAAGNAVAFAGAPDLRLAAHEAAHVVQQRGGVRLSGGVGASGDEYERHADEVADLVVGGKSAESALDRYAHRGAAGGSAVQFQLTDPAHGRGGGGAHGSRGGTGATGARGGGRGGRAGAGPTSPAAHVLRQPDPTQVLDQLHTQLTSIARSYGAEFPTDLFNGISQQLQTVITQGRPVRLQDQSVVVPGGMYSYRFRVGGAVTLGEPTDVREQRGRGTLSDGTQDQTTAGDSAQTTDGSTDTVGIDGTIGGTTPIGPPVTGGGGPTATGSVHPSGSHQSTHSHQTGTTGSDSHQHTGSTAMQGELEHTEFTRQVTVQFTGVCEVVHDAWSLGGRLFGTADTDSTAIAVAPQVIGEVASEQQGAAHPSGGHRTPPAPRPERLD